MLNLRRKRRRRARSRKAKPEGRANNISDTLRFTSSAKHSMCPFHLYIGEVLNEVFSLIIIHKRRRDLCLPFLPDREPDPHRRSGLWYFS